MLTQDNALPASAVATPVAIALVYFLRSVASRFSRGDSVSTPALPPAAPAAPGDGKPVPTPILDVVRRALKEEDLLFQEFGENAVSTCFREAHGRYHVYVNVDEKARRFTVHTAYGTMAPAERRDEVAELIARINARPGGARLKVNGEDGDIYVIYYGAAGDAELSTAVVVNILRQVLRTAERCHGPIMRLLFGELAPWRASVDATPPVSSEAAEMSAKGPIYRWECPKCGKRYEDGKQPVTCARPFYLRVPKHPRADSSGCIETICGAPMIELKPPRVGHGA